ncbi:MAG: hypothetical protein RSA91_00375 [Bacilli bacterium]
MIENRNNKQKSLEERKELYEEKKKNLLDKKEKIENALKEVNRKIESVDNEIAVKKMNDISNLINGTDIELKDLINALKFKDFSKLNEKVNNKSIQE